VFGELCRIDRVGAIINRLSHPPGFGADLGIDVMIPGREPCGDMQNRCGLILTTSPHYLISSNSTSKTSIPAAFGCLSP
jgi:hypothetical protein